MTSVPTPWRFSREGGFDQVRLDTAAELLSIGTLDQKLWVALSCPVKGIEFDARTLSFVDADADGHVRAPELIAALQWAGERLQDADVLVQKVPGVPLSCIRINDETGRRISAAAQKVLEGREAVDDMVTVEAASAAHLREVERATAQWEVAGAHAKLLGEATASAYATMLAVADKVDDWFVRGQLAAFDSRAEDAVNASAEALYALGMTALSTHSEGIAALPLARVEGGADLPLVSSVNPAWAERIVAFRDAVVQPLLGPRDYLSAADWSDVKQKLAPFAAWQSTRPEAGAMDEGVCELEKLARYVRDLESLANNFVSFRDFYARQGQATFQVGTLYLDGRSCDLCVAVNDAGKHASLAALARVCLVYVECVRGSERMSVAAAFTAGDSDQLVLGRNGLFYDRKGRDWDATITKIVEHPISLRQAFWSPYKRLTRLVGDLLEKSAASKNAASEGRLSAVAVDVAGKTTGAATIKPAAASVAPFDVAMFAGIFAAIGLAIGAIGTMLASLVTGLYALLWWQLPLALGGLVLLVSAPAVMLAWFKLRRRSLGPILDANGWAINARARINIQFGTLLTQVARLPTQSRSTLIDSPAEKKRGIWIIALTTVIAMAAAAIWMSTLTT